MDIRSRTTIGHTSGMPYSRAVKANGFVFVSGQVAADPATSVIVDGGIREQTRQVLENLKAAAEQAGTSLEHAVRVTVYLTNIGDFATMNEVNKQFFPFELPTRTTVGVNELSRPEFLIEMDMIAAEPE